MDQVEPLADCAHDRTGGRSNTILAVDIGGLLRQTSNGNE
jgi:hypothetical protein